MIKGKNKDITNKADDMETTADSLADEILIDSDSYKRFVEEKGYMQASEIERFAKEQNVKVYIVKYSLMKEGRIPFKTR